MRYKVNCKYEFGYNAIGYDKAEDMIDRDVIIEINDVGFVTYNGIPFQDFGQGDKTIQEQIEYLTNKGILEEVKE